MTQPEEHSARLRVSAISGYGSKGPACFVVETGGRRLMLDLGAGPDRDIKPDLAGVGPVDALVLSHAHPDHVGALDLIAQLGNPPIYATPLVHSFAQTERFGQALPLPMAGDSTIAGIDVLTGRAGHAPGGIWMRIGGPQGVLYTGDICHEGELFRADPLPQARFLVADASYGLYDTPLAAAQAELEALAEQGPILFPVPAGGRGLEMALVFDALGHTVALCPAHFEVAHAIVTTRDALPEQDARALKALMERVARLGTYSTPKGVMIAAKPNANGGLAGQLVRQWAGRRDWTTVFTGHLASGTPSKSMVEAGQARFVRWNVHPRLSDLSTLIAQSQPEAILPAFVSLAQLDGLARRLPVRVAGPVLDDINLQSNIQLPVMSLL